MPMTMARRGTLPLRPARPVGVSSMWPTTSMPLTTRPKVDEELGGGRIGPRRHHRHGTQKNTVDLMQTRDELYDVVDNATYEEKIDKL